MPRSFLVKKAKIPSDHWNKWSSYRQPSSPKDAEMTLESPIATENSAIIYNVCSFSIHDNGKRVCFHFFFVFHLLPIIISILVHSLFDQIIFLSFHLLINHFVVDHWNRYFLKKQYLADKVDVYKLPLHYHYLRLLLVNIL